MLFQSGMPPAPPISIDHALARFGLTEFRPGQRDIIEAVLDGRPTIAVLPTGAGKSLCYQLPAVALGGLAVVVSPLISLMKDQVDALTARGIPTTFINSSIPPEERDARLRQAVSGQVRLLYVAPERFRMTSFTQQLARVQPALLAIDEAHCMVEWGHDFRPDYARLGDVRDELRARRIVALTATATPDVREAIARQLGLDEPAVFVRGFDRPNLAFSVQQTQGGDDKLKRCLALLDEPESRGRPAIVYAATRKKAEEVALALKRRRVAARPYHAGMSDAERVEVQDEWMANRVRVVVATNAFGMGVDKRDVRLVIHHELPGSAEAYYQEAGRAGRDGEPARCVLLFNHADVRLREFLITSSGDGPPRAPERIDAEKERLRVMLSYAYARGCRRAFIVQYFGDSPSRCGGDVQPCDSCAARRDDTPISDDEQLMVRKALSCVARLDDRFGRKRIALCLAGSDAREVVDAQLDKIPTWGALRDKPLSWILDLLGSLEAAGLVEAVGDDYPCLRITRDGREVMHDRVRASLAMPRVDKPERVRSTSSGLSKDSGSDDSEPVDEALFEKLRALRTRLAAEAALPAYCIFPNSTLTALTRVKPATLADMESVPGIGPTKLAKYGQAFLRALHGDTSAEPNSS